MLCLLEVKFLLVWMEARCRLFTSPEPCTSLAHRTGDGVITVHGEVYTLVCCEGGSFNSPREAGVMEVSWILPYGASKTLYLHVGFVQGL